jgi:transmembrane sensor
LHQLMMYRLTGIINPEEDQQLEQLIQEDPAIKELWEKMQQEHPKEKVEARFQEYDRSWKDSSVFTSRSQQKKGIIISAVKRIALAAAVISGIGIGIYLFTGNGSLPKEHTSQPITANQNSKSVVLTLAGGRVVNLSQQQDSISVAGARLSNTNKNLSYSLNDNAGDAAVINRMNTLTVPVGLDYHILLSDGSEIWLNSATNLQFPFHFSDLNREININGEAYLKIAKDAARPFLVHTPNGTIRVVGTEFNVNTYDSLAVRVALVKGAVRFSAGSDEVNLKPGKEAVYKVNKGLQVQAFEEDVVLGWRKGHYYFYEATLPEITAVLPRWFGVSVKMDNPALRKELFTGMMNRNVPITVFLENIKFSMHIDYYFDKNGVLHFK